MNEWDFTSLAMSWMNAAIQRNRDLPFTECRCEEQSAGSRKRRDLTLHGDGKILVTGEVKMPYQPEGGSPLRASVVRDARKKAARAGAAYFFTWNVNRCALFPTDIAPDDPPNIAYREWEVFKPGQSIYQPRQLLLADNIQILQIWCPLFLHELAEVLRGDRLIERKPPDLRFVDAIEAELEQPILQTTDALARLFKTAPFRNQLRRWMTEDQGWTLHDPTDRQGTLADLNRAAQFTNYALLNKVVFYEALTKRYGDSLAPLAVPDHINDADRLRIHLEGFFAKAKQVTGDYETVFGEDSLNVGNRIPFHADPAVAYWRQLINHVHEFDFSRLDYDVIGTIFERLISPEERHKFGQYYTRAEVVDLLNAFAIRTGREKVLDPACGGGTFLVRAYTRKRELHPAQKHADRLKDLFGTDISHFATHLTTINLATRDLIDDANYPQVARADFFDVDPGSVLMKLPSRIVTGGLGTGQAREVDIPPLDAVVGNPPYIRQEDIPKAPKGKKNKPPKATKDFYKLTAEADWKLDLSGRSDLHVYFWLHAARFLHHGGRLCLLTSSQWLDVEYGFRLQDFILRHFEIEAVFESLDEPWFVGARVATVATVLRRQRNETQRMNHPVRFVQLRRPIAEVMEHDGTGAGAVAAANDFRDHILSLEADTLTDRYRCRVVRQGELWNAGVRLGNLLGKSDHQPADDPSRQGGHYYGGKWGMHLRAPDVWFELIDRFGTRFAPLGDIADVKYGIKSGANDFFFPKDCSRESLQNLVDDSEFLATFGVNRTRVASGDVAVVSAPDAMGSFATVESRYVKSFVNTLMRQDAYEFQAGESTHVVLLIPTGEKNRGPLIKKHIARAEQAGVHEAQFIQNRTSPTRAWYDLTGTGPGLALWPKNRQYSHCVPLNKDDLLASDRIYTIGDGDDEVDKNVLAGILNCTVAVTSLFVIGRPVGNEASFDTMVYEVKMMQVPDPRQAPAADRRRVADAFNAMKSRKALGFVSERRLRRDAWTRKGKEDKLAALSDRTELDMPDRWKLDDAVLRMIGVDDKAERKKLLDKLYAHLRQHFEWTRQKEEKAVANKKRARKKGPAGPAELAAEIVDELKKEHPELIRSWTRHFLQRGDDFVTYEVPAEGTAELLNDLIHPHTVRFTQGARRVGDVAADRAEHAALLVTLAGAGIRGYVRVPLTAERADELHEQFQRWWEGRQATLLRLVTQRTGDESLRDRTLQELPPLLSAA